MSRGATARLFVAVDPPLGIREQLAEWARGVVAASRAGKGRRGGMRALPEHSLHLTLCFLGSRPVGEIDALAAALSNHEEQACELSVGAPLWLPPARPRALAVEVHDLTGELTHLHARVSASLSRASGWEPERRRFRPHVTLVRIGRGSGGVRGSRDGDSLCTTQSLPATPRLGFVPEVLVLYRSWLDREGASYEPLARSELIPAAR